MWFFLWVMLYKGIVEMKKKTKVTKELAATQQNHF